MDNRSSLLWLNVLTFGIGDIFPRLWMHFIMATWRIHLVGEFPIRNADYYASWRKDSIPIWHVVYLIPFCRIVYGSRMPKASTILLPGVANQAKDWDGVSRSHWSPYCIVVISLSTPKCHIGKVISL